MSIRLSTRKLHHHPSEMGGARRERSLSTCPTSSLLTVPLEMESLAMKKRAGSVTFSDTTLVAGTSTETYVRISIGGKSYCVRTELWTEQETLMHRFIKMTHNERIKVADDFIPSSGEYYFERNTHFTDHIMDFFSTGTLHQPSNMCLDRFKDELAFWEIPLDQLAPCCTVSTALPKEKSVDAGEDWETEFDGVCLSSIRLRIWKFMEDPQSSIPAALFAFFSVFFVFASVLGLILGSMPEFQADNTNASLYHMMHTGRRGEGDKFSSSLLSDSEFVYRPTDDPHPSLVVMEYVCIAWFTFEYLVRVTIAPRRYEFFSRTLNLIDLLTILPFYLELALPLFGVYASKFKEITAGCWWCVVTMATVGYGDAKPVTTLGKLVATATSICGIIVLAFPISMIVEKFASAQQRSLEEAQLQQGKSSLSFRFYLTNH
uniref:Ion channel n=1 Tax=Pristionchus pacificus TaxID=54126 RepID=A0A2A6CRP5_PRIPA|eukprot:PDM80790.1 ion channel [Pristionchus pacificus]